MITQGKKKKGAVKEYDESDIAFKKKQKEEAKAKKAMAEKLAGGKKGKKK